ncbi:hypothetical protein FRC00_001390, partial [Tulasnella sp. 408]
MTTTCQSLIEDEIQDLLQGHIDNTNDDADQEGLVSEYQRLKVKADALESQIRVLRDAKRATDMACDLEPLSRSQKTVESPQKKELRERRNNEKLLLEYWKDDSCEPAGEPAPRIVEWTEKTIESVIGTLTQEQADEACKDTDLELNLPWNSPLVTGPLIVRDQLQQRLSPSEKQLADLRWRQNALIPIARVLPELLIDIFELFVDSVYSIWKEDINPLVFVLTRICRDWTRLVFNTPCLWSRISPTRSSLKHVVMGLARSKPALLSIYLEYGLRHIEPRNFFGAIKGYADRWGFLRLRLGSPESLDALNSLCAKVFPPRLKTLQISLSVMRSGAVLPEISFIKGPWHDALQHLDLHGVRLPPGGYGELRGLKFLKLTPILLLDVAEILRALSNSPKLESLSIKSLIELGGELSVGTGNLATAVRLDWLRTISLHLPPASLHAILRGIRAPKLTSVGIDTTMPQGDGSAWTEVLLTHEIQPFVQVVESVSNSAPAISFNLIGPKLSFRAGPKLNEPWTDNTPRIRLDFTGDRLNEVARWMAESLHVGSVEAELSIAFEDRSTSWIDAFPLILYNFHNIVDLKLTGSESISQRAVNFLSTPLDTDSAGSQHFPCPRLANLHLQVHEPSTVLSMLERRYIQHGSTDVTSTRSPIAPSALCLYTYTVPSVPYRPLVQRLLTALPG